jgi:L-iditol 2-dehydrogenase
MKKLVCTTTGKVECRDVAVPEISADEILVEMKSCGICGTDVMKVFDESVPKPVALGHEIVGIVTHSNASKFQKGQRVAVAHHAPDAASHFTVRGSETQDPQFKTSNVDPCGFAELIRVPAALVPHTVHAIPDHVPDNRAVFMEPLACCLRAIERVPVHAGDTVMLIGTGAIGILFVPLLKSLGASVIAVDQREQRLQTASAWGADKALLADAQLSNAARDMSNGRGADIIILTVVNSKTIAAAIESVRDGGCIIPFGVKPGTCLPVDLWQLYRREISVVTSYSATPAGLKKAIGLLSTNDFAFESLVGETFSLENAQQGFDLLHNAKASKVLIATS